MIRKIKRKLSIYRRKPLAWIFRFHDWHTLPLSLKQYAQEIVAFLNRQEKRSSCLEIGCGLGDIIGKVDFCKCTGLDSDSRVLRAARFLNRLKGAKGITFKKFKFPDDRLSGKFDVIILVNWIHDIEPAILRKKIREYYSDNLNPGGVMVIDTIEHQGYRFAHNIDFLTADLQSEKTLLGTYENSRKVWVITKNK